MDIKHVFSRNPLAPAYRRQDSARRRIRRRRRCNGPTIEGGLIEIGTSDNDSFCFDNESPRHKVWLEPFRIANRLDHLRRMDGLHRRWRLPHAGAVALRRLGGRRSRAVDSAALLAARPATSGNCSRLGGLRAGRSRGAGRAHQLLRSRRVRSLGRCRLPTEAEWERVASLHGRPDQGNFSSSRRLHPAPAAPRSGNRWRSAMFGSSTAMCGNGPRAPTTAYPGFTAERRSRR